MGWDNIGRAYNEWLDGTQVKNIALNPTYDDTANANVQLGARADNATWFKGNLGESVIVTGPMLTADRQKLEGYMAWRWGTQTFLPAGHPYLNGPP